MPAAAPVLGTKVVICGPGAPASASCSKAWWDQERTRSRYYKRLDDERKLRQRHKANAKGSASRAKSFYEETVELHEGIRDVQARQTLAIERAIRDAHSDGLDWLLHIDSDECLLVPAHRDAREFFASVPGSYDQVLFHNLEALPESLEVEDWFREVTLFKVHPDLVRERERSSEQLEEKEANAEAKLLRGTGARSVKARKREARYKRWVSRQRLKGQDPEKTQNDVFCEVCRVLNRMRRSSWESMGLELPTAEADSDKISESSDEQERERQRRISARQNREAGNLEDVPNYYNAYSNGKTAVRLRRIWQPPLPAGVHRMVSDGGEMLNTLEMKGTGAPVVLHYVHCGYSAWRRKYDVLLHGHQTKDGAFDVNRVRSLRAHLSHRLLMMRGDEQQLEEYYKTFIMWSRHDELRYMESFGLLVRINAVAALLNSKPTEQSLPSDEIRPWAVLADAAAEGNAPKVAPTLAEQAPAEAEEMGALRRLEEEDGAHNSSIGESARAFGATKRRQHKGGFTAFAAIARARCCAGV